MPPLILSRAALLAYALSTAAYLVFLIRWNKDAGRYATWLIGAGFFLQALSLALRTIGLGQIPILNLARRWVFRLDPGRRAPAACTFGCALYVLGAFVSPLALILLVLSAVLPSGPVTVTPVYRTLWLTLHLMAVFGGYAFFGLAFVAGLIYLIQERQIKARRTGALYRRLPSLNVLDSLNYTSLSFGFPMMTLGMPWAWFTRNRPWAPVALDPKEVWSLILCFFTPAAAPAADRGLARTPGGDHGHRRVCRSAFHVLGVSLILPDGYHSFESLRRLQMQ
jgi:ABC-type transport system involved in cytochrome c biogenesis permease subunit